MDEETMTELKAMLASHANVVRCMAAVHKMRVANDNARAKGKDDVYGPSSFEQIETELKGYAEELAG